MVTTNPWDLYSVDILGLDAHVVYRRTAGVDAQVVFEPIVDLDALFVFDPEIQG